MELAAQAFEALEALGALKGLPFVCIQASCPDLGCRLRLLEHGAQCTVCWQSFGDERQLSAFHTPALHSFPSMCLLYLTAQVSNLQLFSESCKVLECCPRHCSMVGQFLTGYLKRCGLEAEDVPKVAATFLGAKYCVWAASVALAVRYRPLRRVFLSRSKAVLFGSARAARPFAERKRLWLVEALQRLDHVKNSGRAVGSSRTLTTRASLLKKLPSRVRKALTTRASLLKKLPSRVQKAGLEAFTTLILLRMMCHF